MKGINAWAKELKHNEKFARKFEGVQTVQDILNLAKKNGYYFTAEELKNCDLKSVSGGESGTGLAGTIKDTISPGTGGGVGYNINTNINSNVAVLTGKNASTATGDGATAQANPVMNFSNGK